MENLESNISQRDSLENSFANPEKISTPLGEIKVLDIKPEKPKSEVPVLMINGYGPTDPVAMKVNVLEMVRQNRRTLTIDVDYRAIPDQNEKELAIEINQTFKKQVAAILEVLDQKQIPKIDIVAQSEGSVLAIVAAYLYPEKFKNLILVSPAGMIGDDSRASLMVRFTKEMVAGTIDMFKRKKEISPEVQEQMNVGTAQFLKFLWNDKISSWNEVDAIAKAQIAPLFKNIHDNGIGISIIHGVDDKVFPMERMQKQLEPEEGEELAIDGFYSVRGSHGEFLLNAEKYTKASEIALSALEAKQNKNE